MGWGSGGESKGTIVAAVITGAAAIVAAMLTSTGQLTGARTPEPVATMPTSTPTPTQTPAIPSAPEPTPEASTSPDAPPVAMHRIVVSSRCDKTFDIMFHYHTPSGWTSNDGATWRYANGERAIPQYKDNPLLTDDATFFLYAKAVEGDGAWNGSYPVEIAGTSRAFRKAEYEELDNGDYHVAMTCDAEAESTDANAS